MTISYVLPSRKYDMAHINLNSPRKQSFSVLDSRYVMRKLSIGTISTQSMVPQIAQSIYRLTRPQACHTTTSSFVALVSESANGLYWIGLVMVLFSDMHPRCMDSKPFSSITRWEDP